MRSAWATMSGVAAVDFALTFAYAFAANALPFDHSGPSAPWTYWLTQWWVYGAIAPVAAVAAWRGVRQFERRRRGSDAWWRLTAEGAAMGVLPLVLLALIDQAEVIRATLESAALCAGLGLVITGANEFVARVTGIENGDRQTSGSRAAV